MHNIVVYSDDARLKGVIFYLIESDSYICYIIQRQMKRIVSAKSFSDRIAATDWILEKLENTVFTILQGNI